tara:strand:- start:233 stop:2416 length:2184 start_codon:yes stop_codon:yes gene_type:complete
MSTLEQMWAEEEANTPLTTAQMWAEEDESANDQGTISKIADAVVNAAGSAADWVTGANTEPQIPKLSDLGVNKLATSKAGKSLIMGVLASSSDDDRIKKGFQQAIPDAEFSQDSFGNLVVTAATSRNEKGQPQTYQRFYPNPQGADLATAYNVSSVAALAAPVAKFVGGTGYTAAALTGGIEAGLLEAFSSALSNDKYDVKEVPVGVLGALASKPVIDVTGALLGKIKNILTRSNASDMPTGAAAEEIAEVLSAEGFNPSEVMDDVYKSMNKDIGGGAIPEESARYQTAQNLPVPVPMTPGDISGDKSRQLLENGIETGRFGDSAERKMAALRNDQNIAIKDNLGEIQQQMAGTGGQVIDRRAGGESAQQELITGKTSQGDARTSAYETARQGNAFIDPDSGQDVVNNILSSLEGQVSNINAPLAFRLFNEELAPLLQSGQSLNDIFSARQVLTKHANQAGPEGFAAAEMNRQLDSNLINQSNEMLLYGNPDAVSSWLDAISKHKEFMKKWETDGILKKLTSEGVRDGENVLNVAPEDAANVIFGVALNPNRTNMSRDLITLKNNLSPDVWNQLRQEFFIKLSDQMMSPAGEIKGAAFTKAWSNIKKNTTLVNTLFTKEERSNLNALSSTAIRISNRAQNYSNSANSLFSGLRKFFDNIGPTPLVVTATNVPGVKQVKDAVGLGQTYVNPVGKKTSFMKQFLTGVSAVTSGKEAVEGAGNYIFGDEK